MWANLGERTSTGEALPFGWRGPSQRESERWGAPIVLGLPAIKALASETRVRILTALRERPKRASEVSRDVEMSKSTTHGHLDALVEAGLASREQQPDRVWVYYSLTRAGHGVLDSHSQRIPIVLDLSQSEGPRAPR